MGARGGTCSWIRLQGLSGKWAEGMGGKEGALGHGGVRHGSVLGVGAISGLCGYWGAMRAQEWGSDIVRSGL